MTTNSQKLVSLNEFISETLKEFIKGIQDAQIYAKNNNGEVNPTPSGIPSGFREYYDAQGNETIGLVTVLEFEVLVTSSQEGTTDADAGVRVHVFSAGVKGAMTEGVTQASKIKFSIPVGIPYQNRV